MNYKDVLHGKKVTVMGLGLLGRGVGDAKFLAECGAELTITDLKTETELQESVAQLEKFPNVRFVLGEHRMEDFRDRDYILKSADIPLGSPYIEEVRNNNIPIKMSASWFMELAPDVPVIGITGTRGKSTVTHMLDEILRADGRHVLLGGNVRGVSTLALLPEVTQESIGLFELDSWQCQGLRDGEISPNIAVFTSFMDDHMNYYLRASERSSKEVFDTSERAMKASSAYKRAVDLYLDDKAQIFRYQKPDDVLVMEESVTNVLGKYKKDMQSRVTVSSTTSLPKSVMLKIPGEHNVQNAALAYHAALALGVDEGTVASSLNGFSGVPGRLQLVREVNDVKYYNDTTATTPDATMSALRALGANKNIVLIAGGNDKNLAIDELVRAILEYTKHVVMLDGAGTERLKEKLGNGVTRHKNLASAFREAVDHATAGDVVLLSPAFSSFGMFKNEFDRGDQFNALVEKL